MSRFIAIVGTLLLLVCPHTIAQDLKREGKVFVQEKSSKTNKDDIATTYFWKDSKGNEYPIFLHKYTKGDKAGKWCAYVVKVSAKTNKEYKYYIPQGQEIAETIRKEMSL